MKHLKVTVSYAAPPLPRGPGSDVVQLPYIVALVDTSLKPKSHTIKRSQPCAEQFTFNLETTSHFLVLAVFADPSEARRLAQTQFDLSVLRPGDRVDSVLALAENADKGGDAGAMSVSLELTADKPGGMFGQFVSKASQVLVPKASKAGQGYERLVSIDVVAARGLPPMRGEAKTDPYARVQMGRRPHRRTKTKFKTLNPDWRERFEFALLDFGGRDDTNLVVDVWNRDLFGSDDYIGCVSVNLAELAVNVSDTRWWALDLTPRSKHNVPSLLFGGPSRDLSEFHAEICLCIIVADLYDTSPPASTIKAATAFLRVHVVCAHGLAAADLSGLSDPFVLAEVANKRSRTPTVPRTLDPTWDCVLVLAVSDVFGTCEIAVFNEDSGGKYEHLGSLVIPLLSIKNDQAQWFALKSKSLHKPASGYLLLRMHFEIQRPLRAALSVVTRRDVKLIRDPETFNFALLRTNANRGRALATGPIGALSYALGLFSWNHTPALTIATLVGWIAFWAVVQVWHLPLLLALALLGVGSSRFQAAPSGSSLLDPDAYEEDAHQDNDEEEDADDMEDEDADDAASGKRKAKDGGKQGASSMAQIRANLRQLTSIARTVQNLLGEAADTGERVKNLFAWASPHVTMLFVIGLLFASVLLFFVPFRYVPMLWGVNRIVRSGLIKYHPAFRRSSYYRPAYEILEVLSRVPSDVEKETRRRLPVPDWLRDVAVSAAPSLASEVSKSKRA